MNSESLEKGYEPSGIEEKWYSYWLEKDFFAAQTTSDQKPYAIVIPPPNVTGVLHMGHALNITIQDIMCRYRRLCGDNVLWMPGTDQFLNTDSLSWQPVDYNNLRMFYF